MRYLSGLILVFTMALFALGSSQALAHPPAEHGGQDTPPAAIEQAAEQGDGPAVEPAHAVQGEAGAGHAHPGQDAHEHEAGEQHEPGEQKDEHDAHAPAQAPHHEADPCSEVDAHGGADGEAPGHAHWGDEGAQTPLQQAVSKLGAFHAVAVHFPIALILAAALAQVFNLVGPTADYRATVRFLVWTGALGGLFAGLFGWAHAGPPASDEAGLMLTHRIIGTSLVFGLFALAGIVEWERRQPSPARTMVMNAALFGLAVLVALNGFFGGSLAHGGLRHLMGG